jgi:protoporphyrinogen oxidase
MKQRIAIIGGGMTGLVLAYLLSKQGRQVALLEKGKTLSGLLAFTDIMTVPIERYYHHFFTHDHYMVDLLEELGLGDHILWHDGASAIYRDHHLYPFVTKADYLKLPFLSWPTKIRGGLAALKLRRSHPEQLPPALTAETYLRQLFGDDGWQAMWRPLLVNKFGEDDARRISAQWIAKRIQIRAGSARKGKEVLGYIKGSYRVLAERLATAIQAQGGQIVVNSEVSSFQKNSAGQYLINGEAYDIVVSTIAPDLIKKIVPELEIPAVTYRSAIVPLLVLRSSITPYYWINILDTNVPFSVIVNQQALLPGGYYGGQWPLYVGHYVADNSELFAKSDQELFEYYLGYLKQIFPGIESQIIKYEIGRAKHTQPIVTAPWKALQHTTNLPHFYTTSMAHIFPEDRGVNYSIREAKRIVTLLDGELGA